MEESVIYGLLVGVVGKWRQAALLESSGLFLSKELELVAKLEGRLDEEGRDLLAVLRLVLENKMDYVMHQTNIKSLNLGIKIGQELNPTAPINI